MDNQSLGQGQLYDMNLDGNPGESKVIECILNHVVLPLGLPNKSDKESCDSQLLDLLLSSVSKFSLLCSSSEKNQVSKLADALNALQKTRKEDGSLNSNELRTASQRVIGQALSYLPIYVQSQNAGILVHGQREATTFDIWGLTPNNDTIVEATGRVVRRFPECSASISTAKTNDSHFLDFISLTLAKMSEERIIASSIRGIREIILGAQEAPSPTNITELLYIELVNKGTPLRDSRICKHTREEVIGVNGACPYWGRSPFWLFLRVTLHLILSRQDEKAILYKKFMVFFMSRLLKISCNRNLQIENIHCTYSKICRRQRKLDLTGDENWMKPVTAVLNQATEILQKTWQEIIDRDQMSCETSSFIPSSIEKETLFEMLILDQFIQRIDYRQSNGTGSNSKPVPNLRTPDPHIFPPLSLAEDAQEYAIFYLFAFEHWTDIHLDTWREANTTDKNACTKLKSRAISYFKLATKLYNGDPRNFSAMLLRMLMLWVACDKLAAKKNPELELYKPPIPPPYMHKGSEYATTVFESFEGKDAYAVKAFDNNSDCKILLRKLTKREKEKEYEKIEELDDKVDTFRTLMQKYNNNTCNASCEGAPDLEGEEDSPEVDENCARCESKKEALRLKIQAFYRILPKEESAKKTFVYELLAPESFLAWRDFTVFLLSEVLAKKAETDNKTTTKKRIIMLSEYYDYCQMPPVWLSSKSNGLRNEEGESGYRVVLASATELKSSTLKVCSDLTKDNICLDHAHEWIYIDTSTGLGVGKFPTPTIAKRCTIKLPPQLASLRAFVNPSAQQIQAKLSNSAVGELQKYPAHMPSDEFRSLALAPLGHHTRWTNILRQLASPTIDFKKPEAALVLLQIAAQAGPASGSLPRDAHRCLEDPLFVHKLVDLIEQELARIEHNWEATVALWVLIMLLTRTMSNYYGHCPETSLRCLSRCRQVAKQWMMELRRTALCQERNSQKEHFIQKATDAAFVCIATFDVEHTRLNNLLGMVENATLFLECSILIRENILTVDPENQLQGMWFLTWKRISYTGHGALLETITNSKCLDTAIGLSRGKEPLRGQSRWIVTESHWATAQRQMPGFGGDREILFDVLTSQILMNGLPSGKLPQNIQDHPSFSTFFGHARLDVDECNEPGMQYQTVHKIHGHEVSLGLGSEGEFDLLIAATAGGRRYDLIPERLLCGLPRGLIERHVHWLLREGGDVVGIDFRPKTSPWETQDTNWLLRKHNNLFYLERDCPHIFSRQYQGMWVDPRQDIGTLIGLRQKLVLRDAQSHRLLLIPEGDLNLFAPELHDRHARVFIDTPCRGKVSVYELDEYLGKLSGRDFDSNLRLALLHAYTSGWAPDPFTEYTGTERALQIVRSSEVNPPIVLSTDGIKTLQKIERLSEQWKISTPPNGSKRQYVLRTNGRSPLSHHPGFAEAVKEIATRCSRYRIFEPKYSVKKTRFEADNAIQKKLCARFHFRSSVFYTQAMRSQESLTTSDIYYSRYVDTEDANKMKTGDDNTKGKLYPSSLRTRRFMNLRRVSEAMTKGLVGAYPKFLQSVNKSGFLKGIKQVLSGSPGTLTNGPCQDGEAIQLDYDTRLLDKPQTFFPETWFPLCSELIQKRKEINIHKATFYIATLAFSPHAVMELVHILTAALCLPASSIPNIPQAKNFNLCMGCKPRKDDIKTAIQAAMTPFKRDSSYRRSMSKKKGEKKSEHSKALKESEKKKREYSVKLAEAFLTQWGQTEIQWPTCYDILRTHCNTNQVVQNVHMCFSQVSDNTKLEEHFKKWHDLIYSRSVRYDEEDCEETRPKNIATPIRVKHHNVFQVSVPPAMPRNSDRFRHLLSSAEVKTSLQIDSLQRRLQQQALTRYQVSYAKNLERSIRGLRSNNAKQTQLLQTHWKEFRSQLRQHRDIAKREVEDHLCSIRTALLCLGPRPHGFLEDLKVAIIRPEMPRVGAYFIMQQLTSNDKLPLKWKEEFIIFAERLTRLQSWDRLLLLPETANKDAQKELQGLLARQWKTVSHPEWLVFEVENNIRIRCIQSEVAKMMMNPPDGRNSIMQLNMGEGKSSVIVPIAASSMADGDSLVRLIVTRSQCSQMVEIMTTRLGGLLGRPIYHLPVSRSMIINDASVRLLHEIIQDCVKRKGVLVVQPEHILSLNLIISDYSSKCSEKARESLFDIKHWLDDSCRDIIDESDDVFSPKYELVYPLGKEQPIDFARERCNIISQILTLTSEEAERVMQEMPGGLNMTHVGPGRYPRFSLITPAALEQLGRNVARKICQVGLAGFRMPRKDSSSKDEDYVMEFTTKKTLSPATWAFIEKQQSSIWSQRIRQARVPNTSDWSHIEYQLWVKAAPGIPMAWHDVKGVNLEDLELCKRDLFPHLRFIRACIDYYLSFIVFPKQIREYSENISASGWDIGKPKSMVTTGFSGTHDLEPLLPLTMNQLDLPSQSHTDALVLEKMLGLHNSILCIGAPKTDNISAEFLSRIVTYEPAIRVIVDVGTYMIDLTNHQVVRTWLHILHERGIAIDAAIYCDDKHELTVLDRYGKVESLRLSPFSKQIHKCLVFLDEAHSRGTDLKLPSTYKAAVTLGRNLTKDKLAQACMRMRMLGDGQTIMFCIPSDIESEIKASSKNATGQPPSIEDIVYWTIEQTAIEIGHLLPIWAKQGRRYVQQSTTWSKIREAEAMDLRKVYASEFKESDARTIKSLYRPREAEHSISTDTNNENDTNNETLALIRARLKRFQCLEKDGHKHSDEREQERETEREQELEAERSQQRHLSRFAAGSVAKHEVHEDVAAFVRYGTLRKRRAGIIGAFESLSDTTAALHFDLKKFPSQLTVSKDFAYVVKETAGVNQERSDLVKRPVHHILSTADENDMIDKMLIISPFEAEALHDRIAKQSRVELHVYAARQNTSYAPTDELDLYTTPTSQGKRRIRPEMKIELNLFAGQLYFDSFQEYKNVCAYLGIPWNESTSHTNSDGPAAPGQEDKSGSPSTTSTVHFLKSFITNVRHYGGNIEKTHVGRMLSGDYLTESDFAVRNKRKREDEDGAQPVKREKADHDDAVIMKKEQDVEMGGLSASFQGL
ncbi:hypothetical protein NOR_00857 [Metarhizium rileyi]|uniref:ubiquitinyl hydrolase 1 n=1 Tax=Metarhizium rileyi (strain RCEF 4871) TaxID=1649241 RepID=A0A167JKC1_METRR|nr:hypothetical protein NOR_00857 [Metarhizium rileyi RCEF 4871]